MKNRPPAEESSRRRILVLAGIAIALGGGVLIARHYDDWMRPLTDESAPLPPHRQLAMATAESLRLIEWRVYDFIHVFGRKTPEDPDVIVLGIDEASLSLENSSAFPEDIEASRPLQLMDKVFPWSREVYAHLLRRLVDAGASTVLVDLMFSAPYTEDPEGDRLFHEALDACRDHVVLAADIAGQATGRGTSSGFIFPDEGLIPHRLPVDPRIGLITYWQDSDRVIRRTFYRRTPDPRLPEKTVASLVAAGLAMEGRGGAVPEGFGDHHVRFGDPASYEPVSLHELFVEPIWESNFGGGTAFAGKTVFLGNVAGQAQDFHNTPVGRIAGVRVHAHVYAATKAAELLHPLPAWGAWLLIAGSTALAWALVAFCRRPIVVVGLLFAGIAVGLLAQMLLFNHASLVVHASTPLLAFGLVGIGGFGYDFVLERRQKLALKRTVMRFHSPDVAQQILRRPEAYYSIRTGAERSIVVLFSDIRGYTSMSEVLTAHEMVVQLNEYFERMVAIVFTRRGAVDKFIGDALMAVWGRFRDAPTEENLVDDACQAVAAALAMRQALEELNESWRARGMTELQIGIGIHQGNAVVGEIGSHERAELTAIGDSVNLGARLEGATKEYGLDLLVSEPVQRRVADRFLCRTADLVRVKGKSQPVEVFAVMGETGAPAPPGLDAFEEGMRSYRQGRFADAQGQFGRAAAEGLDDPLTRLFIERSAALLAAPPAAWDGVFTMTKK